DNVAEKKKVKESMEANLEKLLKKGTMEILEFSRNGSFVNMWDHYKKERCDAALETLPVDIEAGENDALMKRVYTILIICLGDQKKLSTYYMSLGSDLGDHINESNKLILDLANIDIEIEDEDQALMLLTPLSSSYENFVETSLCGRESLIMEDVLATLNSRELKKRTECTKEETGDGLYVRGMSDHSGKTHSGGSSLLKSRGGTGKHKCFICHSEDHLKRDCQMKKSSGFVRKGKRGIFFYDFKVVDGGSVQLGDNKTCTIKGTGKVKIQLHDASSFILEDVRYVQGLRSLFHWVELYGAQVDRETKVFQVSNDDAAVAQIRLKDKQLEEKTNTDCLVNDQEKVHIGIKVREYIMVTGVPGQEGAEGNVAKNKKVKESMKDNLAKLLKYNALSTRWSPVRGSSMRKRCLSNLHLLDLRDNHLYAELPLFPQGVITLLLINNSFFGNIPQDFAEEWRKALEKAHPAAVGYVHTS
nr:zinc finger, CCHC-type [Tanacetum cinerariifolium]